MIMKESSQFISEILIGSTISKAKIMIPSINTKILSSDTLNLINHSGNRFYLITVDLSLLIVVLLGLNLLLNILKLVLQLCPQSRLQL